MSVTYPQTRERYRQIMADALEDAQDVWSGGKGKPKPPKPPEAEAVAALAAAIFEQLVLHERDATFPGIDPIVSPPPTEYRPPKLGGP